MNKILAVLQALAARDMTAIEAGLVTVIVSLVTGLGVHANGTITGVVTALVAAAMSWFTHKHFAAKAAK